MFGLGHWELVIILVIILIIFGAGKLPEIGGGMGKAIRNFKRGISDSGKEKSKADDEKVETEKIEEK